MHNSNTFKVASRPSATVDITVALAALLAGKAVIVDGVGSVRYSPMFVTDGNPYRVLPLDSRPAFTVGSAHEAIAQLARLS